MWRVWPGIKYQQSAGAPQWTLWTLRHQGPINYAFTLELEANLRENFTITEKASPRAFSWLKVPTSAFTLKTILRHYAKQMLE